jgi:anti-sigma B factor antagonist
MKNNSESARDADVSFGIGEGVPAGDGFLRLPLRGHLDAEGAPVLSERLAGLLDAGSTRIELDFAAVQFISSTGIGTIIAAVGEYRDVGGDIVITGLSKELRDVFVMLDLLDYITLC